jgi:hypothetical protein
MTGSAPRLSAGNAAAAGPWTAVGSVSGGDGSGSIPSLGKETRRQFLYSFQPFQRPTSTGVGHSPPVLFDLACVCALSAAAATREDKLTAGDRDRLAARYSARAVALLGDARKAGFFKDVISVAHMKKDADLEPLRAREDFRKLLAELEQK